MCEGRVAISTYREFFTAGVATVRPEKDRMTSDAARRAERLSTPAPLPLAEFVAVARRPRAAVIAVHGMGQQNMYDTMTSLAGRLHDMTASPNTPSPIKIVNRQMDKDHSQICSEFTVPTTDGGEKDVTVFEAYWAPLTEGKIGFWQTVWFLFVAALWGATLIVKDAVALHGFQRWIFDKVRNYGVSWATIPLLAVTFAGVFGIIAIMAAALAALAAKLAIVAAHTFFSVSIAVRRPPLVIEIDALQTQFTAVLLAMLALGVTIAATFGLVGRLLSSSFLTKVARALLIVLIIVVALAAGLCGFALAGVIAQAGLTFMLGHGTGYGVFVDWPRDILRLAVSYLPHQLQSPPAVAIPLNLFIFWVVYFFGKQFVGDVAIYVSAHRVNRYWDTREAIRNAAHEVAKEVYGCKEGNALRYDEVYFVAHSLGAVVAYDTINAIFCDELVLQQPIDAVNRTKGLLTYGSPLDKTAFLFRAYSSGSVERLAAVAASQPLILSEAFRKLAWINIHSVADPISAPIEYYGTPECPGVDNRNDEQSFLPLVAHVQYEGHETFRVALCELIGARRKTMVTPLARLRRRAVVRARSGSWLMG
jgi:hypothetical protein